MAETWLINESGLSGRFDSFDINFVSNNTNFYNFSWFEYQEFIVSYDNGESAVYRSSDGWTNQAYRTVTFETAPTGRLLTWLEANAVKQTAPAGYEVTFVTNGGESVTKLENVEELPTPLPTTTKTNNIFVGWFYDSGFEVQAFSGDTISSNITLYAKWYANMEDFYEDVADAIRSKNGETDSIKHTDFAYKIKNIQGVKELTQAQYDALGTKDSNTYYLIVEV